MSLYQIIYDFFRRNIFIITTDTTNPAYALYQTQFDIGGRSYPFSSWLCHTSTIITLIMGVVILYMVVRWIFKVFAGLIRI